MSQVFYLCTLMRCTPASAKWQTSITYALILEVLKYHKEEIHSIPGIAVTFNLLIMMMLKTAKQELAGRLS